MHSPSRLPRALVFWLFLAAVAIVTGALRESVLRPLVGEPWAHWIGTLAVCAIFVFLIGQFVNRLDPPAAPSELWTMGIVWLLLTVCFEMVFGRLALGSSWRELLGAYDPGSGRIWWLVLLTVLLAPPVLGRGRAREAGLAPIERRIEFISEDRAAEAMAWLADLFRDQDVRYAAAGGLAARAWGATRPLVDLDFFVHGEDLDRIETDLAPYLVRPLTGIRNDHWDLSFMRLEYSGIPLELSVAEGARYREAATGEWHDACPTFSACPERELLGVKLRIMDRDDLVEYKRRVDRAVDRADVAAIERAHRASS
ncbi:MAG: hypothetical protein JJE01_06720 [Gemmatimonadetes bacterium]|nr:hypothetical protein [Gemmatimonadota bacterium]